MSPVKPQDPNTRASASAEDLDDILKGQSAADAEAKLIQSWTSQDFAGGGRQQLQNDASFGSNQRK
jgi:hypothetical protein